MAKHMKSLEMEREHSLMDGLEMHMYPMFHVDHKQMPEIMEWEVGEEYPFKGTVKMTHKDESEHGAGASFEITEYESTDKKHLD